MDSEEKKQQQPTETDVIHIFEQAEAQSANVARYVGGLYKDLVDNGVPEAVAGEIVKVITLKILGAGL